MQKARGQAVPEQAPANALPLLVGIRFQVLFHSPQRGSFHLSLTVLVHYRSQARIEPWEMVLPVSHGVPRVPWYSGSNEGASPLSPTGLSPCIAGLSRHVQLENRFLTPRPLRSGAVYDPTTPPIQRLRAWHIDGLGCSPFARRY